MSQKFTIYGSLDKRSLTNSTGATAAKLPALYEGDEYIFQIRLLDKPDGVNVQLVYPNVRSFSCSIGPVNIAPLGGFIQLKFGTDGGVTEKIAFNEDAIAFKEKLQAAPECATYILEEVYTPAAGCWMLRFNSDQIVPLQIAYNLLEPATFCRINQFTRDGRRWVEIKLIQAPVSSTATFSREQGDIPTVTEVRKGNTEDDILFTVKTTEIQSLKVPSGWSGTFALQFQGLETVFFSADSGTQDYQDGLNALFTDGIQRFKVTNPVLQEAYIEFVGPLAGIDVDNLVVIVGIVKPGDVTFTLDLNTVEVNSYIRSFPKGFDSVMEVILEVADDNAPPEDPGQRFVLFQAPVSILPELQYPGVTAIAPIDWLTPPQTVDFIPFTPDQIITGSQYYVQVFGDGTHSEYMFPHNLGTESIAAVTVRENHDMGVIIDPSQYVVTIIDDVSLKITFPYDVVPESLVAIVTSAGPKSAFQAHTHTIAQIIGLQDLLNSILARLAALEAVFATLTPPTGTNPFGTATGDATVGITINDKFNLIPTNRAPLTKAIDSTNLPPPGLLLPAIHDVIELGSFTANPTTDEIILTASHAGLVDGQRARIDIPIFVDTFTTLGGCTFNPALNIVTLNGHGLANDRQVKFSGGKLPDAISTRVIYFVINATVNTFQISIIKEGDPVPLISTGDTAPHHVLVLPESPGGLLDSVDYFMITPTSTTFKLSETIGGPPINITSAGYPPVYMSTIEEAPSVSGVLPDPGPLAGNAYSVREDIVLRGGRGIPAETVHAGDIVASDGRVWYHVTRSDSPGSNSFYPTAMEEEIFTFAINENMLPATGVLTLTFNLSLQMFKHDTNSQFVAVIEVGDLPEDVIPAPTGPNLYEVVWNKTPIMQQQIIVTEVLMLHTFGAQVSNSAGGLLSTNKKQYSLQLAGDAVPVSSNFAIRLRLIEFDTEDNVLDASGLVYYTMDKALAQVTSGSPTS